MLFAFVGLLTYMLIPQIIIKGLDAVGINLAFSNAILPFVKLLPELDFSAYGLGSIKHADMAIFTVQTTIAQILIQYTLPLRSILWSMWYKELNNGLPKQELPTTKKRKSKKRPSEKLMEASKKRSSKAKLDDDILRRAMEKDNEG